MSTLRHGALALALLLPATLRAQDTIRVDSARVDSIVAAGMAARHLVGISVGVMEDGRIVLVKAYGQADLSTRQPMDTTTRLAIGSVTKQFTCALILQLAAEGKLSVDDTLSRYFPDFTRAGEITLRDLMGHVSGYPDYYPLDFVDRRMLRRITPDSLARWYGHLPLDFDPDTRWSYSNTGFIILGRVAELVTGRPYPELLRSRIFEPLGMTHTDFEPAGPDRVHARGYSSFALSDPEYSEPEAQGWAGAAGGIYSTPTDLLIWDRALMEGRVVRPEYLQMMTTPRRLRSGASTGYGFGLSIGVAQGDTIWSHGGAVSGFAAQNTMVPRTRSAVVVLSNEESSVNSFPLVRMAITSPPPRQRAAPAPSGPAAPDPKPVPDVAGPSSADEATALMQQLQSGRLDRSQLGDEVNWWLTDEKVRGTARRLGPLGPPTRVERMQRVERGGMEVTLTRFTYATTSLNALMYRTPDGKVQEFLVREP